MNYLRKSMKKSQKSSNLCSPTSLPERNTSLIQMRQSSRLNRTPRSLCGLVFECQALLCETALRPVLPVAAHGEPSPPHFSISQLPRRLP